MGFKGLDCLTARNADWLISWLQNPCHSIKYWIIYWTYEYDLYPYLKISPKNAKYENLLNVSLVVLIVYHYCPGFFKYIFYIWKEEANSNFDVTYNAKRKAILISHFNWKNRVGALIDNNWKNEKSVKHLSCEFDCSKLFKLMQTLNRMLTLNWFLQA